MEFLKVCIISKFPPIQGGIASKTYWLARGCAEAGLEVHVVTNASAVEDEYKIGSCGTDYHLPVGVVVHNVEQETPWHIPYSQLFQERLLNKVLEVCNQYKIDLIDSHYLVPYGIVAFLAGTITEIPYIIRHGGSDLAKFWDRGLLNELLKRTISNASALVTDRTDLKKLNKNSINLPRHVPDERCFYPKVRDERDIVFAYIGKINYYWQHKSLDNILGFWNSFSSSSSLVFLAQGKGKASFLDQCKPEKVEFFDFIPPWGMPSFLQKIDYLFYLVDNNPIPDFSNTVVEAVACGAKVITDDPSAFTCYQQYFDVPQNILAMESFHLQKAHITPKRRPLKIGYSEYILDNVNLYSKIISL